MKVSGFMFIRNAVQYDYPVLESIQSVLPLCDEFIINECSSYDDTLKLLATLNDPKIRIIHSDWDLSGKRSCNNFSTHTNRALDECTGDWRIYMQADEVWHEKDHNLIRSTMDRYVDDVRIKAIALNWKHFWGGYWKLKPKDAAYPTEVRIIKNDPRIRSYGDAQGFNYGSQGMNIDKPASGHTHLADAYVYHYGWSRDPVTMFKKAKDFDEYYHPKAQCADRRKEWEQTDPDALIFNYGDWGMDFGSPGDYHLHPAVMKHRIAAMQKHPTNFNELLLWKQYQEPQWQNNIPEEVSPSK